MVRRRQHGGVMVMAVSVLAAMLLLTALGINLGAGLTKRDLVDDAADMLAPPALKNQWTYRNLGNPDTAALVSQLVEEGALVPQLGSLDVQYVFGWHDGTTFTPLASPDPDPQTTTFNAVAVEVCAPLIDAGGLFEAEMGSTCGQAIAVVPLSPSVVNGCRCGSVVCAGKSGLGRTLCMTLCTVGSVLRAVLDLLFTLSLNDFVAALDCIFRSLFLSVDSAFDWLFGPGVVTLHYGEA